MQDPQTFSNLPDMPVSDMIPLTGVPNLYNDDERTSIADRNYFYIMPSSIYSNIVCTLNQNVSNINTGSVSIFDLTTQSVLSSISLSGISYEIQNLCQRPSFIELSGNNYCVLEGTDLDYYPCINITDFNTNTIITGASILSICGSNVNFTDPESESPIISSIDIVTKEIISQHWINDAHNTYDKIINVYETIDSYVTVHPTTFQVICFNKDTKETTLSFNIQDLTNAPTLTSFNTLYGARFIKTDYHLTTDKSSIYIKCDLKGIGGVGVAFMMYIDPSNISNCNVVTDTITYASGFNELYFFSVIITPKANILTKQTDENIILYKLDKYNAQAIGTIPGNNPYQFTALTNGMICSIQSIQDEDGYVLHPFMYSIFKIIEYVGIWLKPTFLRMRVLGYI